MAKNQTTEKVPKKSVVITSIFYSLAAAAVGVSAFGFFPFWLVVGGAGLVSAINTPFFIHSLKKYRKNKKAAKLNNNESELDRVQELEEDVQKEQQAVRRIEPKKQAVNQREVINEGTRATVNETKTYAFVDRDGNPIKDKKGDLVFKITEDRSYVHVFNRFISSKDSKKYQIVVTDENGKQTTYGEGKTELMKAMSKIAEVSRHTAQKNKSEEMVP